ncbi:MAG: hypothetical protein Q4B88_01075 [Moraxella sp.]|nr:hypothetical protein [Moraxella sp.]
MKLTQKFNTLSPSEYRDVIKNHQRYANFNPLGLYRSLLENPKLDNETRLEILNFANQYFAKFYEFLIVKDINLYAQLSRLDKEPLSESQKWQYRERLKEQAKQILKAKKIKNWRVGIYTKSVRMVGYDEEKGEFIDREIMTQENSQKYIDRTKVRHIKERKHKAILIKNEIENMEVE